MKLRKYTAFDELASQRVSFILLIKNRTERLAETLNLMKKIVRETDELIIIDGSSQEHSSQISEVIDRNADLIDICLSEPDMNSVHAFNKGILISNGKYIKVLTDDDIFYPEEMEKAIQVMEEHPEIDHLICGGTRQIGDVCHNVWLPPGVNYGSRIEDPLKYGACGCGFLTRRSIHARVGLLTTKLVAADVEFVLKCISKGANVKFCRINLFHHTIYNHSHTVKEGKRYRAETPALIKKYCSKKMYFLYLLKNKWKVSNLAYRALRKFYRIFQENIFSLRNKSQSLSENKDVFWDGGFS